MCCQPAQISACSTAQCDVVHCSYCSLLCVGTTVVSLRNGQIKLFLYLCIGIHVVFKIASACFPDQLLLYQSVY